MKQVDMGKNAAFLETQIFLAISFYGLVRLSPCQTSLWNCNAQPPTCIGLYKFKNANPPSTWVSIIYKITTSKLTHPQTPKLLGHAGFAGGSLAKIIGLSQLSNLAFPGKPLAFPTHSLMVFQKLRLRRVFVLLFGRSKNRMSGPAIL